MKKAKSKRASAMPAVSPMHALRESTKLTEQGYNPRIPQAFEAWVRSMPQPAAGGPIYFTVRVKLCSTDWSQVLQIMAQQSWTLDQAITEILTADKLAPINEFLNECLNDEGGAK